jgi:hypothetical protein
MGMGPTTRAAAMDGFSAIRFPTDERALAVTLAAAQSSRRILNAFASVFLNPAQYPIPKQKTPRVRSAIPNGLRTPQEVAARLGVSVKQVKTLALKDGELRFINTGRGTKNIRMMFTDTDVEDFIKRRAKRNAPQQQSPSTANKTTRRTMAFDSDDD